MERMIEHSAFVRRSFADVCHIFERDATAILARATVAASHRATTVVSQADQELPGFDSSEELTIQPGELIRDHDRHAWIEFRWQANPRKRLLASVEARLDIRPLIAGGPAASTELTLWARYTPRASQRRSRESALFGRRVVKVALHRLLEDMAEHLEEYEESMR
jgi:hypothetical protein